MTDCPQSMRTERCANLHFASKWSRGGFTMIELVVVFGIIVILAGILLPAAMMARNSARATTTTQRMASITTALQSYQSDLGSCFAIQKYALAVDGSTGESGVIRWGGGAPVEGAALSAESGTAYQFQTNWMDAARGLNVLNPRKTIDLMTIAGILTTTESAPTGGYVVGMRGAKYAWNDAWGNPLVVAYGLYQPSAANLANHLSKYGYNRAVYISTAAVGSFKPTKIASTTLTDWTGSGATDVFKQIWDRANAVCNASNVAWDWTNPPWVEIKRGRNSGQVAFLAAPVAIR